MSGFALHLMRHGAPERPGLLLGRTDDAPTPAGIAACLERARGLRVEALVHSGMRRTRMLAQALADTPDSPLSAPSSASPPPTPRAPIEDRRWRELDFGAWDGLAPDAVDPAALARFRDDPDACPPPEGERWSALVARVGAAMADLPPRPTLVLTHGGTMRAAMAALFGFATAQLWAFDLPYGALLSLRLWPDAGPADGTLQNGKRLPGALIAGLIAEPLSPRPEEPDEREEA